MSWQSAVTPAMSIPRKNQKGARKERQGDEDDKAVWTTLPAPGQRSRLRAVEGQGIDEEEEGLTGATGRQYSSQTSGARPTLDDKMGFTNDLLNSRLPLPATTSRPKNTRLAADRLSFLSVLLHLVLLYGPALYTSRVSQALEDVETIKPVVVSLYQGSDLPSTEQADIVGFKAAWADFIDSLVREWESLNIITALLLACVHFLLPWTNLA